MINKLVDKLIKPLKQNKALQIALMVVVVLAAIILILTFDLAEAQVFIRQNRRQATLISIMVYFLLGFTFIPASPLTLFLTYLLGPLHAVLIATVGNTLAAILEYQIGATVGDVFNFEGHLHQLPFGLAKLPITSPILLMAGRLLPIGKRGFSVVCGAYQVPLGVYVWTSMMMYVIDAMFVAFVGTGLIRLL
jgi:uncharacterized membrane protein YdjX (TVP38/TMEM64 family)